MRDRFGVRPGCEAMPGALEPRTQRLEVVDLAVQDDRDRTVLVVDRLPAGDQIDDAEPPVPEPRHAARRHVFAVAVGSAVGERTRHRPERGDVDRPIRAKRHLPGDPTHD